MQSLAEKANQLQLQEQAPQQAAIQEHQSALVFTSTKEGVELSVVIPKVEDEEQDASEAAVLCLAVVELMDANPDEIQNLVEKIITEGNE